MNKTKKHDGLVVRVLTAVLEKIAHWICFHDLEISPVETQMYLWQCGMGAEEARMLGMLRHSQWHAEVE